MPAREIVRSHASTGQGPAGWPARRMWTMPAASMSVATAGAPQSFALRAIARNSSSRRGLMVGTPLPPDFSRHSIPRSKKIGPGPSAVKASEPASAAPPARAATKSRSSMGSPMFIFIPARGAERIGIDSRMPKNPYPVSGSRAPWIVARFSFTPARASWLAMKEEPVPVPPMPGISPAHILPSHRGHTRQAPLNRSLATRSTSLQSMSRPPKRRWKKSIRSREDFL